MDTQTFLTQWHELVNTRDLKKLDVLLDDNAVLLSPVLHSPKEGKAITKIFLTAALSVFANESFKYVREFSNADSVVLEFETEVNGIYVNGVDMIKLNEEGKIIEFKVMVRPLKALNMINEMMTQMIQSFSGKK
ncbi:nuclear transport factor 2 family protein [Alkalimarinus alittae]|uniref:Nuclear transport factor 2 family protein n=1 Tax=Alkalimarinus alittae TaxID=2961619 RepID=A0ABY6MXI8_9ALTE|nr:nuclear transport factor 2 family protein [Alkalimarinus alittae]UZE94538.1 nuclear transport factor 2 family protein [Alkalimarinus alittae]